MQDDDDYLFNIDVWSTNLGQQRLAAAGLKDGYEEHVVWPGDAPGRPVTDRNVEAGQKEKDEEEKPLSGSAASAVTTGRGTARPTARPPAADALMSGGPEVLSVSPSARSPPSKRQKTNSTMQDIMDEAEIEAESRGEMLCIDAKHYGNIGRFLNHSCAPNCIKQAVFSELQDVRHPHMAFFAIDDIPPLTEFTYDYNYREGSLSAPTSPLACVARPVCFFAVIHASLTRATSASLPLRNRHGGR